MTPLALALWDRAECAMKTAAFMLPTDPNAAASRAYYAAFYAMSAYFAADGRSFNSHSALLSAVHRDLVRPGLLTVELGRDYTFLHDLRSTADYGGTAGVPHTDAADAVNSARRVLDAVIALAPGLAGSAGQHP